MPRGRHDVRPKQRLPPAVNIRSQDCLSVMANDIFWSSVGSDLDIWWPSMALLTNDDVEHIADTANTQASNILSVDPLFNPDLSLQDLSPMRQLGNSGGFLFSPGEFDLIGNPRIYQNAPISVPMRFRM